MLSLISSFNFFLISAFLLRYSADWEVVGLYILISSALLIAFYLAGANHWLLNTGNISVDKRKNSLRRYQWIFPFCRNYIEYSIIFYLVLLSLQLIFVIRPEWYLELIFLLVALGNPLKKDTISFVLMKQLYITMVISQLY